MNVQLLLNTILKLKLNKNVIILVIKNVDESNFMPGKGRNNSVFIPRRFQENII